MPILAPTNRHLEAAKLVENLAVDVRRERTRRTLYQSEAAKQIGITTTTLNRLEMGTNHPTWATIIRCLRWLGR